MEHIKRLQDVIRNVRVTIKFLSPVLKTLIDTSQLNCVVFSSKFQLKFQFNFSDVGDNNSFYSTKTTLADVSVLTIN